MRRLIALCLVMAAACTPASAPNVSPTSLRNPTAVLGSQVDVTGRQLAGDWRVRQIAANNAFRPGTGLNFTPQGDTLVLGWTGIACVQSTNLCESFSASVPYLPDGPGRWRRAEIDEAAYDAPSRLWVYWTDFDRRTLTIGDPDGSYVMILDRNPTGGADRLTAAREILDWYGYDVRQLVSL